MAGRSRLLALAAWALLAAAAPAGASSGDANPAYGACVRGCLASGCADLPGQAQTAARACSAVCADPGAAPAALRLLRWDCEADCRYLCMWTLEGRKSAAASLGGGTAGAGSTPAVPEKYHGKWPFARVLGVQEPASVAFSLLNLLAQAVALHGYWRRLAGGAASGKERPPDGTARTSPTDGAAYGRLWVAHGLLACNAWLWSAVFHSRDTRATEQLDYFSAGAMVAFGLFATLARVLRLRSARARTLLAAPLAALYAERVAHMRLRLFDYGMWTGLCVAGGAIQTAAWLGWAAGPGRRHPGRGRLLAFLALLHAALLLELFDFPPFFDALDAHALWHLATAPLGFLWFSFLGVDLPAAAGAPARKAA